MCEKMCEQDSSKEEDEKCETNWYQAVNVNVNVNVISPTVFKLLNDLVNELP